MKILKLSLVFILLYLVVSIPQTSSQTTTSTPIPLFEFSLPFPGHLHCPEIISPHLGSTWKNFQVGVSTINELDTYMTELDPNYSRGIIASVNFLSYTFLLSIRRAEELGVPSRIDVCFDPQTQIITAISPKGNFTTVHLADLLIEYGEPDTVTWEFGTETRIAFWFEEGIAATIRVDLSEQFAPYGTVLSMTYFPYQEVEGFEERWPYNRTVAGERVEELELRATLTPDVPNIANPFDFDAMIATITAQPSRTPTPTFTPVATEVP